MTFDMQIGGGWPLMEVRGVGMMLTWVSGQSSASATPGTLGFLYVACPANKGHVAAGDNKAHVAARNE
jgi:hypothetical protein